MVRLGHQYVAFLRIGVGHQNTDLKREEAYLRRYNVVTLEESLPRRESLAFKETGGSIVDWTTSKCHPHGSDIPLFELWLI